MKIHDQIQKSLRGNLEPELTAGQIKDKVIEAFGGNPESIIPSDYCYNRENKGSNQHYLFKYLGHNQYEYLGPNFRYNGDILSRPRGSNVDIKVGFWINGEKTSFLQADRDKEIREREEATIIRQIESDQQINETEKQAIIKARRGQGLFKNRLFNIEKECRLTGITNPNHLIGSHIKPWAKCDNNTERLDGNNGLLLAPQIDHLFDKGYISFEDDGTLLISSFSDLNSLQKLGVIVDQPVNVGLFNEDQQYYLRYHRENVFKK